MSNQITMLEALGDALKTVGKFAAKTWAPKLTDLADRYTQNIKTVLRSFDQPKAALDDLFKQNPDTFRECKLVKLEKNNAAGVSVATGAPVTDTYKGSYKAIFKGYVKEGNDANSPLQYSDKFSVTIKPTRSSGSDLKYIADTTVFINDVMFAKVKSSYNSAETAYKNLFKLPALKSKFILATKPNFNSFGDIKKGQPQKGMKLNFDGEVIFGTRSRPVADEEYIIVKNKGGILQSDGELYSNNTGSILNASVINNYDQKNMLFESKKLVDLFCK